MPNTRTVPLLLVATLGIASAGRAQPAAEPDLATAGADAVATDQSESVSAAIHEPERWTLRFEPSVWFVAPAGDVKMPGSSDALTQSIGPGEREFTKLTELEIDRPEASPMGEINLGHGNWRFCLRGFSSSSDAEATTLGPGSLNSLSFVEGDIIESSLDFLAAELEVAYSLHRNTPRLNDSGREVFRSNLEGLAGARIYDVDWEIANSSSGAPALEADETFLEPLIGGRFEMEFYERLDLDLQLTVGGLPLGDDSSFSVDVIAGFMWRPFEHFGIQIGYRQLLFDLQSGEDEQEFEYDGTLAGLFGGLVFDF